MNLDLHFVHRIQQQAKTRANMTALRYKERGLWRDISWKNFQEQLNQLSRALLAHNIDVQDKIAILPTIWNVGRSLTLRPYKFAQSQYLFTQPIQPSKQNLS